MKTAALIVRERDSDCNPPLYRVIREIKPSVIIQQISHTIIFSHKLHHDTSLMKHSGRLLFRTHGHTKIHDASKTNNKTHDAHITHTDTDTHMTHTLRTRTHTTQE